MAQKRRFLDVWILESNTVYREVPFPVVADWVQQGRLLENDMLRPSGTAEWFKVGASPEFSPYLPRPEADRVEDQAEALEPVELDFRWKKRLEDEDDDVDMIPLIDVSLVLLIFFMLTASGAGLAAFVPTPPAKFGVLGNDPSKIPQVELNVNLEGEGDNRRPVFSFTVANKVLDEKKDTNLQSIDELLGRLREYLDKEVPTVAEVTINAHPDVKSGLVREITAKLEAKAFRDKIFQKYYGTSDVEEH